MSKYKRGLVSSAEFMNGLGDLLEFLAEEKAKI
jgi:hypothetical protein